MIIVQLKGGLGNQLFQYAAALSLAEHHSTVVKVDTTELNQGDKEIGTVRSFDLQKTVCDPKVATIEEIQKIKRQSFFTKYVDKFKPPYQRKIYKEAAFGFDEHFFRAKDNIYLKGYRQSERYFLPIEHKIRNCFKFKAGAIEQVKNKASEICTVNSIAIHIRRGDYAKVVVKDFHGIPDKSYYQDAIIYFEDHIPEPRFFIFSDDPEWVKQHLGFNAAFEMVSGEHTSTAIEDFHLISQCKHQVIANSTFSWWAAWLNPNPDKIVIAPEKWFNNAPYDTKDLIPKNWIKM